MSRSIEPLRSCSRDVDKNILGDKGKGLNTFYNFHQKKKKITLKNKLDITEDKKISKLPHCKAVVQFEIFNPLFTKQK